MRQDAGRESSSWPTRLKRHSLVLLILALIACRRQTPAPLPTQPLASTPTPTQTTRPSATSTTLATVTPILPGATATPIIHVVKRGDSLSGIAFKYDVAIEALVEANGIADTNVIRIGQELIIPGPTPIPTATLPPTVTPTTRVPPTLEIVEVIGRGAPATETVVIVNRGHGFSIEGWTLRDAQGNVYVFPQLYLGPGAEVRVHTGGGDNTPLHLFWNRDTAVWQEAGDTAVVADPRGVIYASKQLD
jgi:LysM repeat protein